MDPGNYEKVVGLLNENVTDEDRRGFKYILGELVFIYSVVASQEPRKTFCLAEFGERAEALQIYLAQNYPWFNLGSYLHIACSHTLEILESQESIGRNCIPPLVRFQRNRLNLQECFQLRELRLNTS